jgi:acyl carrier protein
VPAAAIRLRVHPVSSPSVNTAEREKIRVVLSAHAALPTSVDTIADDADLFQAGMASFASVNVMLGLEDAFDIEFPDSMLTREVFRSVDSIATAIGSLIA